MAKHPATNLLPGDQLAVDARGAAALCSVSERHWRGLDTSGRCPAPVRLGGSVRWLVDDLRHWLSAGCPGRQEWEERRSVAKRK